MIKFSYLTNRMHGGISQLILKRDGYKCVLCESSEDLLIDHIKRIKLDGDNNINNQRTLCRSCHSKITNVKNYEKLTWIGKYLREWRKKHPEYNKEKSREFRKKNPKYYNKYYSKEKYKNYVYAGINNIN